MRTRRGGLASAALALVLTASRGFAQSPPPLHGLVGDLRFITASVPTAPGWTPPLTAGVVPGRGFGGELGASAFLGPGRSKRLFVGGSGLLVQGRAAGVDAPAVTTRMRTVASQAGVGFGRGNGWSYLSGGVGAASVSSEADGDAPDDAPWALAFHYGGGARWFLTRRVALSLDLRFWALTPRQATSTRASGPATTRVAFGAGLAFR